MNELIPNEEIDKGQGKGQIAIIPISGVVHRDNKNVKYKIGYYVGYDVVLNDKLYNEGEVFYINLPDNANGIVIMDESGLNKHFDTPLNDFDVYNLESSKFKKIALWGGSLLLLFLLLKKKK